MKFKIFQFTKRLFPGLKFIIRKFIVPGGRRFKPNLYDLPSSAPHQTALDQPGEFSVKKFETSFRNQEGRYSATVYFPIGSGTYPFVVFSPGLGAVRHWYQWIGEHLASHGYLVLIFTVPVPLFMGTNQQEAGFISACQFLEQENVTPASSLFGAVEAGKRAVMGHSLGGAAALAAAAKMDIQAVIALAPAPVLDERLFADIVSPTQIQVGSFDTIAGEVTAASFYDLLAASPRQFLTLNGANHLDFHDVGSLAYTAGNRMDHPPTVDTEDHTHRLACRYFTAWLDRFLKGDTGVEGYLFGSEAQRDLESRQLAVLKFEQS